MSEYEKSSESATESEGAMMGICQVCDFLGANSHFGTLTCRACAEFFRRSIHQSRDYKCRYEAEEEGITMPREKVKHCRHCRLQKCHAIGMRADAVDSRLLARRRRKKTTCLAISPEFIPFKQDQQIQAVQSLCYVIEKFQRLYFRRDFPTAILAKAFSFGNLREILEWTDKLNLIGGGMPPPHHQSIENVQILGREKEQAYTVASCYQCRNGTANFCMTQSLLVLFDLVKTISAFHQIGMDDKIFHLSSIGMPFLMFCYYFHSCQLNIGAMLNRDGTPVMPIFKEEKYAGDKTVENITEYMFVRAFKRFHQSGLVKEEWVLLKAILLTQPVSFNLSSHAQLLLQSESEKYATMFLRLLQQRLGHMAGASRYSELLGLIQLAYNSARRRYDFINYLDIFYENGKITGTIPRALASFCTLGSLSNIS